MNVEFPQRRWGTRGAIAALVIVGLLFTSVYPLRRYFAVKQQVTALRTESASLDKQALQLRQNVESLQSDATVEQLARDRLGMVAPGETAFSMPRAQVAPEPTPTVLNGPGEPKPPADDGVLARWWDAFRHVWGFH